MNKLVLFDIDGTLIYHIGKKLDVGFPRFEYAVKKVFGLEMTFRKGVNYNGWVDRQIAWYNLKDQGITREEFDRKFSALAEGLHEYALRQVDMYGQLHAPIDEAVGLAMRLSSEPGITLGILSGNVERVGMWKLVHAGVPADIFRIHLFADEADDRIALARTVHKKSMEVLKRDYEPSQIVVIGDAVNDVRCGKAIGAVTIAVMTGRHTSKDELAVEKPDFLVDTLDDNAVYDYFSLSRER